MRLDITAVACLLIVGVFQGASANDVFDLVVVESGQPIVAATIELSILPATLDKIVELRFSSYGEEVFGLGPRYGGRFDEISPAENFPRIVLAADGGLGGSNADLVPSVTIFDNDPPLSNLPEFNAPSFVSVGFWHISNLDSLQMRFFTDNERKTVAVFGNWLPSVPEPSSAVLLSTAMLFGFGAIRKRRR